MCAKSVLYGLLLSLTTLFGCITASKSDNCIDVVAQFYKSATPTATLLPVQTSRYGIVFYFAEGDVAHGLCLLTTPAMSCFVLGDVKGQCKVDDTMVFYYGSGTRLMPPIPVKPTEPAI